MTLRPSLLRSSLVLAAVSALTGQAFAQRSEAEIRADIDFARGLASEWSMVGLATEVLDVARTKNPSADLREELTLAGCDVYAAGARIERDDTRRNELFGQALEQYQDFLSRHPASKHRARAENGIVTTAVNFSKSVDIALESLTGEAADKLKKRKIDVLEETVKLTAELIQVIKDTQPDLRTAQQLQDAAGLMLNRGQMLGAIGEAQENGTYFFDQAIISLEDMVFFFTEGTPQALRAYQAMGDVYRLRGNVQDAYYMYEGVLNQAWPADPRIYELLVEVRKEQKDPISDAEWAQRYLFLEISMAGLLDCTTQLGQSELSCALAMHFYNCRQQLGLSWSISGYESLLACAATLLDAGGYIGGSQTAGEARWFATEEEMKEEVKGRRNQEGAVSFALKLANTVNNDNKGNILQVKAQKLISEIASRPGVVVSVDVLIQAAEGDFYDGNYDDAAEAFKRVLASLETRDTAEQLEYSARVYNFLANTYRRDGRPLEAAMAFKAGLEANDEDLEYTELNAKGYRAMIKVVADANPSDEFLKTQISEAEDLMLEYVNEGDSATRIHISNAEQAVREKRWADAISHFEQVSADSNYAEKARVGIATCTYRGGDASRALTLFESYLDFAVDQVNTVESPIRKQKRKESVATAEFYRGYINYDLARRGTSGAWEKVDQYLSGFPERHAQQEKLKPLSLRLVMEARLATDNRAGAKAAFEQLVKDHRDSGDSARASVTFYNILKDLQEASTDADEAKTLLREMADLLKIANSILKPDYQRMRNESKHWVELGEFNDAERALLAMHDTFRDDAEMAKSMVTHVLPDLGHVLLENHKVEEAKEVLAPLVVAPGASPSKDTVIDYCRSVSGWLIGGGNGDQVSEVPGAGGSEEEWQAAVDSLHKIWQRDKWECQWYEYRLMHLWTYYQWGKADSRKSDSANTVLTNFNANFNVAGYAEVEEACADEADADIQARLGSGVLQSRLQYMNRMIK